MMSAGNGQLTVPPGFRFHPTDEELLYYYLRKKVSYEAIDLDVIREVDLNKLEPWDLKEKCRIGSGPQNEWYFFSHKDKKYPTGTRTNRATTAGFWKATGRDKAIHLSDSKRIGMRKTLVFYTGRAPHGQKTDWIMHEYRLEDHHDSLNVHEVQEDGWVVCRVFKKKNHINRGYQQDFGHHQEVEHDLITQMKATGNSHAQLVLDHHHHHHQPKQNIHHHHPEASLYDHYPNTFDGSMHLPQLFSPESAAVAAAAVANSSSFASPLPNQHNMSAPGGGLNPLDLECSQNLLKLTSTAGGTCGLNMQQQQQQQDMRSFNGDWSFLDKLLSSHHPQAQAPQQDHHHVAATSSATQRLFPFQYLGGGGGGGSITTHVDLLKFSK